MAIKFLEDESEVKSEKKSSQYLDDPEYVKKLVDEYGGKVLSGGTSAEVAWTDTISEFARKNGFTIRQPGPSGVTFWISPDHMHRLYASNRWDKGLIYVSVSSRPDEVVNEMGPVAAAALSAAAGAVAGKVVDKVMGESDESSSYVVKRVIMDVAFKDQDHCDKFAFVGGAGNHDVSRAIFDAVEEAGFELAGDMIEATDDLTDIYRGDDYYDFYGKKDYIVKRVELDIAARDEEHAKGLNSGFGAPTKDRSLFNCLDDALEKCGYEMAGDGTSVEDDYTEVYRDNDYEFFTESCKKINEDEDDDYPHTTATGKKFRKSNQSGLEGEIEITVPSFTIKYTVHDAIQYKDPDSWNSSDDAELHMVSGEQERIDKFIKSAVHAEMEKRGFRSDSGHSALVGVPATIRLGKKVQESVVNEDDHEPIVVDLSAAIEVDTFEQAEFTKSLEFRGAFEEFIANKVDGRVVEIDASYDDLGMDESVVNEGNPVSSKLPGGIDSFLQDIAQIHSTISYKDIMDHDYTDEDIKKLRSLRRKWREEAQYDEDPDAQQACKDIADKVAKIVKESVVKESFKVGDRVSETGNKDKFVKDFMPGKWKVTKVDGNKVYADPDDDESKEYLKKNPTDKNNAYFDTDYSELTVVKESMDYQVTQLSADIAYSPEKYDYLASKDFEKSFDEFLRSKGMTVVGMSLNDTEEMTKQYKDAYGDIDLPESVVKESINVGDKYDEYCTDCDTVTTQKFKGNFKDGDKTIGRYVCCRCGCENDGEPSEEMTEADHYDMANPKDAEDIDLSLTASLSVKTYEALEGLQRPRFRMKLRELVGGFGAELHECSVDETNPIDMYESKSNVEVPQSVMSDVDKIVRALKDNSEDPEVSVGDFDRTGLPTVSIRGDGLGGGFSCLMEYEEFKKFFSELGFTKFEKVSWHYFCEKHYDDCYVEVESKDGRISIVVHDNSSIDKSQDRESNPLDDDEDEDLDISYEDLDISYEDLKVETSSEGDWEEHQESNVKIISQLLNSPVSDIEFGSIDDEGNFSPSDYIRGLGEEISSKVIEDEELGLVDEFSLIRIGNEEIVIRYIMIDAVGGYETYLIYRKKR